MKNRNVLFTVLGIIVLVVLMIGVFYHFRDRKTYTLNLPKLEKLESISLKQNEKNVIIMLLLMIKKKCKIYCIF